MMLNDSKRLLGGCTCQARLARLSEASEASQTGAATKQSVSDRCQFLVDVSEPLEQSDSCWILNHS